MRGLGLVGLGLALVGPAPEIQAKQSHLVIIAGLGGEEGYREKFHEWSMTMRQAAIERHGLGADRVFYLGEDPEKAPDVIHAKSTKENIVRLFGELAESVKPGDQIYVLLVGHGSYDSDVGRFNLPGPDMTADDFDLLLAPFGEQQVVLVNASSASGSFLAPLSGRNRVVVTATKSGFERNETHFGGFFVEAYAEDGADTDKNERLSVLEAFTYAQQRVKGYYEENNLLASEHSAIDDEAEMAGSAYLIEASDTVVAGSADPSDPELARLTELKRELEGRVEALRLQKGSMPEDVYLEELEKLLVELAETTEQIERRRQP